MSGLRKYLVNKKNKFKKIYTVLLTKTTKIDFIIIFNVILRKIGRWDPVDKKCQLPRSHSFEVKGLWWYFHKGSINELFNELFNNEGAYRTAPATMTDNYDNFDFLFRVKIGSISKKLGGKFNLFKVAKVSIYPVGHCATTPVVFWILSKSVHFKWLKFNAWPNKVSKTSTASTTWGNFWISWGVGLCG